MVPHLQRFGQPLGVRSGFGFPCFERMRRIVGSGHADRRRSTVYRSDRPTIRNGDNSEHDGGQSFRVPFPERRRTHQYLGCARAKESIRSHFGFEQLAPQPVAGFLVQTFAIQPVFYLRHFSVRPVQVGFELTPTFGSIAVAAKKILTSRGQNSHTPAGVKMQAACQKFQPGPRSGRGAGFSANCCRSRPGADSSPF